MLNLVFRIGFNRGLSKLAVSAELPRTTRLFGTMKPASNLKPVTSYKKEVAGLNPDNKYLAETKSNLGNSNVNSSYEGKASKI